MSKTSFPLCNYTFSLPYFMPLSTLATYLCLRCDYFYDSGSLDPAAHESIDQASSSKKERGSLSTISFALACQLVYLTLNRLAVPWFAWLRWLLARGVFLRIGGPVKPGKPG